MRIMSSCVVSLSAVLILAGVGLVGCAPLPKDDLKQARIALDDIKAAKADIYAPESYEVAEDAFNFALVEIQEQEKKFAPFRSYSHAEVLLTEAEKLIKDAKDEAEAGREEARRDAETLIGEAKISYEAAKASKKKVPSRRRAAAQSALEGARTVLFEAEKNFKNDRFFEARRKAEDAKARSDQVGADPGSFKNPKA
jgi:hypothetical protein